MKLLDKKSRRQYSPGSQQGRSLDGMRWLLLVAFLAALFVIQFVPTDNGESAPAQEQQEATPESSADDDHGTAPVPKSAAA
jgi:hypothetical protein